MRVPFSVPAAFSDTALARSGRRGRTEAVLAATASACAGLAGIFAFAEITHWASSRRRLGTTRSTAGSDQIIVVLGYGNRGERANGINRFRVRAGVRSIDPRARSAVIIFCGGAVAGSSAEAVVLERFARRQLGFTGRSLLETESTTTWENIANATSLIDAELKPGSLISIVSNSHHAEKARDHLRQMRPDLARLLVRGGDYRFGEEPFAKPIAAIRGLAALRTLDRQQSRRAKR